MKSKNTGYDGDNKEKKPEKKKSFYEMMPGFFNTSSMADKLRKSMYGKKGQK